MLLKTSTLAACAALMTITLTTPAAMADEAGEIKYRKGVMQSIGGHMGNIANIIKGGTMNKANLQVHTDGLAALAGIAGSAFPEESAFGDTQALPAVWDKPEEFAKALKETMNRLREALNDPPYNWILHTTPLREGENSYYHWHLEIIPKLTRAAGFEWGTGFYINPVSPEEACKILEPGQGKIETLIPEVV